MASHGQRWLSALVLLALVLAPAALAAAANPSAAASVAGFPPALESYQDDHLKTVSEILRHRAQVQPMNLIATLLFFGAVIHTFFTHKFRELAHQLEERHTQTRPQDAQGGSPPLALMTARMLHFLGEVEAVFGIWVLPLALFLALRFGHAVAVDYFNHKVGFNEPLFVVVIMTLSATRPVLRLAEQCLRAVANLGGGGVTAWWFSILTIGPLLGSLITEPAAMTISALLLAKQFYSLKPRSTLAYATLGLLFVNVSIGGTLTHFAAPPVLMVAAPWGWGTPHMLGHFGWKAVLAIVAANAVYFGYFRKDFTQLQANAGIASQPGGSSSQEAPVPIWVTVGHLLFMMLAVFYAHLPVMLVGSFLFFLAFFEVTKDYQSELQLRPAILVGFFLAGLVIHGGLQQWWIAPVLGKLGEVPLMLTSIGLTAFNDNAAITYLATLVPGFSDAMKHAVVAGAVAGGGLTVIANAPNPAGQAILGRFFPNGVAPLGLLLGALVPTLICTACFLVFR
jgi:hypothetical protein